MSDLDLENFEVAYRHMSDKDLNRSIFIYRLFQKPALVKLLSRLALVTIRLHLPLKFLIRRTVYKVFCAGENQSEVLDTIRELRTYKVDTVLDYVAEGGLSESSFKHNYETILKNIDLVSDLGTNKFVGVKLSGLINSESLKRININDSNFNIENSNEESIKTFVDMVDSICRTAKMKKVKVYFDAEEYATQSVYDEVVRIMMSKYNQDEVVVFNTIQLYLKDRIEFLNNLLKDARSKSYLLGLKLVRGAYVEQEREWAKEEQRQSPVFDTKLETDQAYDEAVNICLKNHEFVHTCLATHNKQSVELATKLIKEYSILDHQQKIYFSQLFGMSDNLTYNLSKSNYNASKYVPYGEIEKAIPYLLRRAEENSSMEGQVSREYEMLIQESNRRKKTKGN